MTMTHEHVLPIDEDLEWVLQEDGCPPADHIELVIARSRWYYDEISPPMTELRLSSATVGGWRLPRSAATRLWEQIEETFAGVI